MNPQQELPLVCTDGDAEHHAEENDRYQKPVGLPEALQHPAPVRVPHYDRAKQNGDQHLGDQQQATPAGPGGARLTNGGCRRLPPGQILGYARRSLTTFAGIPTAIPLSGTSLFTKAAAPASEPAPIDTPSSTMTPVPNQAPAPIRMGPVE